VTEDEEIRELARKLGRRGGLKGAKARTAKITPTAYMTLCR
jgi:hypothetical protein